MPPLPADIRACCRTLRRRSTDAEGFLWYFLRDRRFGGKKFRRQHPVGRYILDFYCERAGLAIELDGGQHAEGRQKQRDQERDQQLTAARIRVLRFWNSEVWNETEAVLEKIWRELHRDDASAP